MATASVIQQLATYGPERCERLDFAQASDYTRRLAQSHYENFTVVSWLLPRRLRRDFQHVYAFCRWADDLGDEAGDPARALELLAWWRRELDACYAGQPRHPVFVALLPTIRGHDIPRQPFDDLIDAFVQDQRLHRYESWDQVLDYCTRSANPVGRLVLYLCDYRDPERQAFSDATCTALQLANFWQDVRRDVLERDRVYIPASMAASHGLDIELMVKALRLDAGVPLDGGKGNVAPDCPSSEGSGSRAACCDGSTLPSLGISAVLPSYRATLHELVERTLPLFRTGRQLWPLVASDVRVDIHLFTLGGESVLRRIERQGYDTLTRRPSLGKAAKAALMFRAVTGKLLAACSRRERNGAPTASGSQRTGSNPAAEQTGEPR